MGKEKTESVKDKLIKVVQEHVKKVVETKQPESIVLFENEYYAIQLLILPPTTVQYGAVTTKRDKPAVLLSIRSTKLWRNNLTIPSIDHMKALTELLKTFDGDEEIKSAVAEVLTPRGTTTTVKRISL